MNCRFLKARQVRNSVSYSAYIYVNIQIIGKYMEKKNYIFLCTYLFFIFTWGKWKSFFDFKAKKQQSMPSQHTTSPTSLVTYGYEEFFTTNVFPLKLSNSWAIYKCSFLTSCSHQLYSHRSQLYCYSISNNLHVLIL